MVFIIESSLSFGPAVSLPLETTGLQAAVAVAVAVTLG
jgi:hypothetical protein